MALVIWVMLAAPIVALVVGIAVLRQYVEDLPRVPDLESWDRRAPQTSVIVAADGSVLARIPFRHEGVVGHR